jgi:aspartate aminotransferase
VSVTAAPSRIDRLAGMLSPVMRFVTQSAYARRVGQPGTSDFAFGNPHEMPLPGLSDALRRWTEPRDRNWFAYKQSEPEAREVVAESLRRSHGLDFRPEDVFMTNGAFAALAASLLALTDPGDEVVFVSPPWFFYEAQIAAAGAVPVRVRVDPATLDLDLGAIEAAITPHTRAVIVNSPNNPTGRIYTREAFRALAALLEAASARNNRTVYLLSDEAYRRIVFDGHDVPSPSADYPATLVIYTYGKTLLSPGERVGYVAVPPTMPGRDALRPRMFVAQFMSGYAFPNAILQYALRDLDALSIDVNALQARRDRLVGALRGFGYDVHSPQGTFYLLPRSPWPDDVAFTELLAEDGVLCMPGEVVEMPGYFRISITANDEMVSNALPGFERAFERASRRSSPDPRGG